MKHIVLFFLTLLTFSANAATHSNDCQTEIIRIYPLTTGYETERKFPTEERRVMREASTLCDTIVVEKDNTLSLKCPVDDVVDTVNRLAMPDKLVPNTRNRYIRTEGAYLTSNGHILASFSAIQQAVARQQYLCRVNIGRSPGNLSDAGIVTP